MPHVLPARSRECRQGRVYVDVTSTISENPSIALEVSQTLSGLMFCCLSKLRALRRDGTRGLGAVGQAIVRRHVLDELLLRVAHDSADVAGIMRALALCTHASLLREPSLRMKTLTLKVRTGTAELALGKAAGRMPVDAPIHAALGAVPALGRRHGREVPNLTVTAIVGTKMLKKLRMTARDGMTLETPDPNTGAGIQGAVTAAMLDLGRGLTLTHIPMHVEQGKRKVVHRPMHGLIHTTGVAQTIDLDIPALGEGKVDEIGEGRPVRMSVILPPVAGKKNESLNLGAILMLNDGGKCLRDDGVIHAILLCDGTGAARRRGEDVGTKPSLNPSVPGTSVPRRLGVMRPARTRPTDNLGRNAATTVHVGKHGAEATRGLDRVGAEHIAVVDKDMDQVPGLAIRRGGRRVARNLIVRSGKSVIVNRKLDVVVLGSNHGP